MSKSTVVRKTYADRWASVYDLNPDLGWPQSCRLVDQHGVEQWRYHFRNLTPDLPGWGWRRWMILSPYARTRTITQICALGLAVFVWRLIDAGPHPLRIFNVAGFSVATTVWLIMHIANRREVRHGRNRSTQEDHRDPQAVGAADPSRAAGNPGGAVSADPCPVVTEPQIDTVQEDMPILAHRAARIVPARSGPTFASLNRTTRDTQRLERFGVDEDATCHCTRTEGTYAFYETPVRHDPCPSLHGLCGWYAVPADVDSWHDETTVDLLVELSGRVIEHELGYRAEHQRVIEVRVPPCRWCGEPSTLAIFDETACKGFGCADHAPSLVLRTVSLATLAKRLGVPMVTE